MRMAAPRSALTIMQIYDDVQSLLADRPPPIPQRVGRLDHLVRERRVVHRVPRAGATRRCISPRELGAVLGGQIRSFAPCTATHGMWRSRRQAFSSWSLSRKARRDENMSSGCDGTHDDVALARAARFRSPRSAHHLPTASSPRPRRRRRRRPPPAACAPRRRRRRRRGRRRCRRRRGRAAPTVGERGAHAGGAQRGGAVRPAALEPPPLPAGARVGRRRAVVGPAAAAARGQRAPSADGAPPRHPRAAAELRAGLSSASASAYRRAAVGPGSPPPSSPCAAKRDHAVGARFMPPAAKSQRICARHQQTARSTSAHALRVRACATRAGVPRCR